MRTHIRLFEDFDEKVTHSYDLPEGWMIPSIGDFFWVGFTRYLVTGRDTAVPEDTEYDVQLIDLEVYAYED